jgi:hypothetical protein
MLELISFFWCGVFFTGSSVGFAFASYNSENVVVLICDMIVAVICLSLGLCCEFGFLFVELKSKRNSMNDHRYVKIMHDVNAIDERDQQQQNNLEYSLEKAETDKENTPLENKEEDEDNDSFAKESRTFLMKLVFEV